MRRGQVLAINKCTLRALGHPGFLHFWWSESEKVLLIHGSPVATPYAFKVSEYQHSPRYCFRCVRSALLTGIMYATGMTDKAIYVIDGVYHSQLNMVAFRLIDARIQEVELDG